MSAPAIGVRRRRRRSGNRQRAAGTAAASAPGRGVSNYNPFVTGLAAGVGTKVVFVELGTIPSADLYCNAHLRRWSRWQQAALRSSLSNGAPPPSPASSSSSSSLDASTPSGASPRGGGVPQQTSDVRILDLMTPAWAWLDLTTEAPPARAFSSAY